MATPGTFVFGRKTTPLDPNQFIDNASARVRGFQSGHAAKLAQNEQFLRGITGADSFNPRLLKKKGGPRQGIDPETGLADPDLDFDRILKEEKERKKLVKEKLKEEKKAIKDQEKAAKKKVEDRKKNLRKEIASLMKETSKAITGPIELGNLVKNHGTPEQKEMFAIRKTLTGKMRENLIRDVAIKKVNELDTITAKLDSETTLADARERMAPAPARRLGSIGGEGSNIDITQGGRTRQLADPDTPTAFTNSARFSTPSYNIGDILKMGGRRLRVKGFFEDGEPDVEEI